MRRTDDNLHSLWIARLKVLFPLVALGILSILFLLADRRGTSQPLRYSDVEVERIIAENRAAGPAFSAVTGAGDRVSVSADGLAGLDGDMTAERVTGRLTRTDGKIFDLVAESAEIPRSADRVALIGDVGLTSPVGWQVDSDRLDVDVAGGSVVSPGPVVADGPPGRLTAGAMRLDRVDSAQHMTFTDGVTLVYDPTATEGPIR